MSDFQAQYALWDEFLKLWPVSRLATMSLSEYSQAGSRESFTYWIESRLDQLGSIWGGSAFKFGVYSRKASEEKSSDAGLRYSDTHAWYASLGATADEAFAKVRAHVVQVATLAAQNNVDGIDAFDQLGDAFKWKIAFHYQNRQAPAIIDIFKRAPLAAYLGTDTDLSMATLHKAVLARRPAGLGLLEFGQQVWETWSRRNLAIWKLSHGNPPFSDRERQDYLDGCWAVMGRDTGKDQGRKFAEAPVGALFFLCHGNSPQCLGRFTSEAMPSARGEDWLQRRYQLLRSAQRTDRYTRHHKGWSPQGNTTFWRVAADDLPEFESSLLRPYFGIGLEELATLNEADLIANASSERPSAVSTASPTPVTTTARKPPVPALNRIYYGPPGTGKTYALKRLLQRDYARPAQTLSVEDWRQQLIVEKVASLKWWEGVAAALYQLGRKATVTELVAHPYIQAIAAAKGRSNGIRATLWGTLQNHTVRESVTVNLSQRQAPAVFDKGSGSVWQFAGDWQEACADLIDLVDRIEHGPQDSTSPPRYRFVTFHQSFGYEEFVEGLRPVLTGDAELGEVAYEIRSGVFKELCRLARQAPDQRFAMVIDEINRGNVSKIFGELITLIEADKRDPLDGSPPPAEVTLAYSGEKFSVPANVDIIGSMNTADRSLALLDTALRRRFEFVALLPDTRAEKDPADPDSAPLAGLVVSMDAAVIDIRLLLQRINERITALYDRDHTLGHAYFTGLSRFDDGPARFSELSALFRKRVIPLLEEYFFEDWRKIHLVLGDNQKRDPALRFILENEEHAQGLNALFGPDSELDSYAIPRRYAMQETAFSAPLAYIGIYQTLA